MRWLIKKIFTLLTIVFIIISIYFIITIIGNKDEIVEAYNRITYTKQEGADNIRTNFLQVYSTYGEDLFIALGVKKSDFALSGAADSPSENPEEYVPFCTCTQKCLDESTTDHSCSVCAVDYTQCAQILICVCAGPDKCSDSHVDSNCRACTHDSTLCVVVEGQTNSNPSATPTPSTPPTESNTPPPEPPGNGALWSLPAFFKQNEGTQAGWNVGGTSKTVAKIGCAITSLINLASWEGVSDLPAKFESATKNTNNFTSSGGVYWDRFLSDIGSSYRLGTRGASFDTNEVCSRLDNNQPTLFYYSSPNSYYNGSQHFVFVLGYDVDDSTNEVTFTVADPAYGYKTIPASDCINTGVQCNYFN